MHHRNFLGLEFCSWGLGLHFVDFPSFFFPTCHVEMSQNVTRATHHAPRGDATFETENQVKERKKRQKKQWEQHWYGRSIKKNTNVAVAGDMEAVIGVI